MPQSVHCLSVLQMRPLLDHLHPNRMKFPEYFDMIREAFRSLYEVVCSTEKVNGYILLGI